MAKTVGGDIPTWLKLDNAAKIYPPSRTRGWAAMFRLSVTLTEPIDPALLAAAQRTVLKRLPTFAYRLRRGLSGTTWSACRASRSFTGLGNPLVRMDLREERPLSVPGALPRPAASRWSSSTRSPTAPAR